MHKQKRVHREVGGATGDHVIVKEILLTHKMPFSSDCFFFRRQDS